MIEDNYRFYEEKVKPLIHEQFGAYENRIAVGIAGEGLRLYTTRTTGSAS